MANGVQNEQEIKLGIILKNAKAELGSQEREAIRERYHELERRFNGLNTLNFRPGLFFYFDYLSSYSPVYQALFGQDGSRNTRETVLDLVNAMETSFIELERISMDLSSHKS